MGSSNKNLLDKLFEKRGFTCAICGQRLTPKNAVVEHLFPTYMGGSEDFSNLQLVCVDCNARNHNKAFLGYQFEAYIKQLLSAHPSYHLLDDSQMLSFGKPMPDIVCKHRNLHGNETIIGEIKLSYTFTSGRINSVIQQLLGYREENPDARLVFITPSEMPQRYHELIKENGIELWDKAYLSKEFAAQIASIESDQFKALFQVEEPENEFDLLIKELKDCPTGIANWGIYEKLVGKLLERLFCPPLNNPLSQSNDISKKNRRDYVLPNYASANSRWEFLRNRYSADFVVVDAKNSGKHVKKDDVLQIANYLKKDGTGLFGIIFSRKGANDSAEYAVREMWRYEGKMIVILNDTDVEVMLLSKKNGADPVEYILKKIEDFRLSI